MFFFKNFGRPKKGAPLFKRFFRGGGFSGTATAFRYFKRRLVLNDPRFYKYRIGILRLCIFK